MSRLSEDFQSLLKKFGPPAEGENVPASVRASYATRVPQAMLDFWAECGTGLWLNGYFQLCRPDRYQSLLTQILHNDPDFPAHECALIGFSAFGDLLIWNNKNYMLTVSLSQKYAYTGHLDKDFPLLPPDRDIAITLLTIDDKSYDLKEKNKKSSPLFKRAVKKLGSLHHGECYGFIPVPELGGLQNLEELHKRPALPYFQISAELSPIELRFNDFEHRTVRILRKLGAQ